MAFEMSSDNAVELSFSSEFRDYINFENEEKHIGYTKLTR